MRLWEIARAKDHVLRVLLAANPLSDALVMMTRNRVRHVRVLEDGARCSGIVSLGDLVAAQLAEAWLEGRVLRGMARAAVACRTG